MWCVSHQQRKAIMLDSKNQVFSIVAGILFNALHQVLLLPDPVNYLLDPPKPFKYSIFDLENLTVKEGVGYVETLHKSN